MADRGIDAYHDGSWYFTEVVRMDSIDSVGGVTDALQRPVQVWEGPRVGRIARWHACDPQLADDALHSTSHELGVRLGKHHIP